MRICTIEGCGRKHEARGFCAPHYQQYKKYGKIIHTEIDGAANGSCVKHSRQIRQMRQPGRILKRTQNDPNEIIISGDIAYVVLYGVYGEERARAIIDIEVVEKIKKYKWSLAKAGYVQAHLNAGIIYIHHVVMGILPNMEKYIDHRDENKLNNCKSNLRFCTNSENMRNRGKQKNNKSGYKGVYQASRGSRWVANIRINRKTIYIGTFTDLLDAAKAYNKAAIEHHGRFARLNKI